MGGGLSGFVLACPMSLLLFQIKILKNIKKKQVGDLSMKYNDFTN